MCIFRISLFLLVCTPLFCRDEPLSVVIIGGGPAGLATAIEAKAAGANVTILEKREHYSRDQFLFLLDPALNLLNKWKVSVPNLIILNDGDEENGVTDIKSLEMGLARRVNELGIPKILGESQELKDGKVHFIHQNQKRELSYDIVVGADGAHSAVRNCLNIATNHYGKALGTIAILPSPKNENMDYIAAFKHEDFFINKIVIPTGTIISAQAKELSKERFVLAAKNSGWVDEAKAIAAGTGKYIDKVEIVLEQSVRFYDSEKSAIIIGDAAASASYLLGMGVNCALEEAVVAGLFFKTEQTKADYAAFNTSMEAITHGFINESAYLFNISKPH